MEELIQQFIDELYAKGCQPARAGDIKADDKWHRYTVQGDKKPNARYQLKIDGGRAIGRFIYFKDGESHSWHSKTNKKWTAAERKEYKDKLAAARKQHAKEQAEEFAKAAADCLAAWRSAKPAAHPYLKKKDITKDGSRVADLMDADGKLQKNVLLIPIYKNNKISSLQRIWPNGFKAFWEGADVNGGYTAFANADDDKSTIIVCEGWATGKSLRAATGMPVIVAFNTGNLLLVALLMRSKYPHARIIIAADNDQWTFNVKKRIEGIDHNAVPGDDMRWGEWHKEERLWNPGLEKARQAAVKIGAHVIFPDIPQDDKNKNTDFNDLHAMRGLDAVKDRILVAAPANQQLDRGGDDSLSETTPPDYFENTTLPDNYECDERDYEAEYENLYGELEERPAGEVANFDWRKLLFFKEDEVIKGNSLKNVRVLLQYDPDYKGIFCYDEFSQEKVVAHCPPWEKKKDFKPRQLRDEDVTQLAMHMEFKGMALSIQNYRKVLETIIIDNGRNPAKEYFKNLKWDGVSRLNTWLREYCGCKHDDPEYLAAIGGKWLVAAVARVMNPGCKFDHILILEGDQNLGKSLLLRELATFHGKAYFDDTIKAKDLAHEKTVPKLQGIIICELAEMTGFDKMGTDEAKQVISTQIDRIVKKYANEPTPMPRQFVFAGSINPKGGYLNDPTGDRRYWPALCSKMDIAGIKRDREQLWAEAMHRFNEGEQLWLEGDLYKKATEAQKRRSTLHPWYYDIENKLGCQNIIKVVDIWDALIISDRRGRTKESQSIITDIMVGMGYEWKRTRDGKTRDMAWVRKNEEEPDFLEKLEQGQDEEIPW